MILHYGPSKMGRHLLPPDEQVGEGNISVSRAKEIMGEGK